VAAVKGMLARPDFLIPLVAAERQFRDHYYGLNSAALLEDLFYDALGNYLRQVSPLVKLERPPPGQKGWDYRYDGLQLSHKVSQNISEIAALWDATKTGVETWSFEEPITYVLGGNAPRTQVTVGLPDGDEVRSMAAADLGAPYLAGGRTVMVVAWPGDGRQPILLDIVSTGPDDCVSDVLPFSRIWDHLARHVEAGGAANEIDVLVTRRALPDLQIAVLEPQLPAPIDISVETRGGVYVFALDTLQNLAVTSNNRAILIPTPTVKLLLQRAVTAGNYNPLPLWYWMFANRRPPDMYSAQRAEYDARFSARGDLDG